TLRTDLATNDNIQITLQNLRETSVKLQRIMNDLSELGPDLKASGQNVKELTETVKSQPWRLIWPSTKKYPEDNQTSAATTTARKPANAPRRSSPTPAPRIR
ncbi:MAG: hypothetical protein QOE73_2640, partial [Verrucomicrobiota bacterium]